MDAAEGRTAYSTYITCIEKYFIPYFGDRHLLGYMETSKGKVVGAVAGEVHCLLVG